MAYSTRTEYKHDDDDVREEEHRVACNVDVGVPETGETFVLFLFYFSLNRSVFYSQRLVTAAIQFEMIALIIECHRRLVLVPSC